MMKYTALLVPFIVKNTTLLNSNIRSVEAELILNSLFVILCYNKCYINFSALEKEPNLYNYYYVKGVLYVKFIVPKEYFTICMLIYKTGLTCISNETSLGIMRFWNKTKAPAIIYSQGFFYLSNCII